MNSHQIMMHLLIIKAHNWIGTAPDWLGLLTGMIGTNGRTHGEIRLGISTFDIDLSLDDLKELRNAD